jgi:hypothetical protein
MTRSTQAGFEQIHVPAISNEPGETFVATLVAGVSGGDDAAQEQSRTAQREEKTGNLINPDREQTDKTYEKIYVPEFS